MHFRITLIMTLTVALLLSKAEAWYSECSHPIYLSSVDIKDLTLEDAVGFLRRQTAELDRGNIGVNFVIDTKRIPKELLTQRVSFQAKNIPVEHVIWAICRQLGLGYRIDIYAVLISSRNHVGLREAPTKELRSIPDGLGKQRFLFLVISANSEKTTK